MSRSAVSTSGATRLVLRCRRRIAVRRLRERAFELLVLAPLIVGAVAWVAARYLDVLRPPLLDFFAAVPSPVSTPALVLALALVPVLWPGALRELWGHAPLDGLPVPELSRFAVTLVASAGRALGPAVLLVAAARVLLGRWPGAGEVAALVLGCVLLSWLTVLLSALLVHWAAASTEVLLALAAVAAGCTFGPVGAARWLLLPWGVAGMALHGVFAGPASAPGMPAAPSVTWPGMAWTLPTTALVAVALAAVHTAWRRRDLERSVSERGPSRGATLGGPLTWPAALEAWLPESLRQRPLRALLRRDLLLVRRRFSPAVHVAAGLVLACLAGMAVLGFDSSLALVDSWRRQAMVAAGTLGVLAAVAVVPFLLRAQLPVFWLEKVTGVPLDQVWRAKVVLAHLVALPVLAAGLAVLAVLAPGDLVQRLLACLQLTATAGVVASLLGLASFEIATEPLIGTLWSGLIALALSSLFILYSEAWWMWAVAYVWVAGEVAKRASRRVRLTRVTT